jgi:hypothetical protein
MNRSIHRTHEHYFWVTVRTKLTKMEMNMLRSVQQPVSYPVSLGGWSTAINSPHLLIASRETHAVGTVTGRIKNNNASDVENCKLTFLFH